MSGERVDFPLCGPVELSAGEFRGRLPTYGILDLGRVLPAGLPAVDGILGLDAFAGQVVTLQLSGRRLVVTPAGGRLGAGWTEVPMRIATGVDGATAIAFIGATVAGGRKIWLELDSGNLDVILLAPGSAAALSIPSGEPSPRISLTLGELRTAAMPASVRELIHDGALNAAFLERYDLRLDLSTGRAWLRPAAPRPGQDRS